MPREIKFSYSVINITTHPHSPEGYIELFKDAFSEVPPVKQKYYGDSYISLRLNPNYGVYGQRGQKSILYGSIYKYTRIADGEWYDGHAGIPLKDEDKPEFDTDRYCPNLNEFPFVFFPQGHRLFFITSHRGERISTAYFANALDKLLNRDFLKEKYDEVIVNVETDSSGIEAIINMQRMERLDIDVSLPNGDDISEEEEAWRERLQEQGVTRIKETLKSQKNGRITPDKTTLGLMRLAQSNGYIEAQGVQDGERIKRKSSEFPVEYHDKYFDGTNILEQLIRNGIAKLHAFTHRNENE
jgi:hypothetical protein